MWVPIPTVVLLVTVTFTKVSGGTVPQVEAASVIPTENQGQPWPANAAGYSNFSQLPQHTTQYVSSDIPPTQSAPTNKLLDLDMSNPNTSFANALQEVLAPELSSVQIKDQSQTIPVSINITPPPNATMDFIAALQTAVRKAINKLIPSASTTLKIAITKSPSGAIVNVKAFLDVLVPSAAKKITPTLPPSTVPEIDLTKGESTLIPNLQNILTKELVQAGYDLNSKSVQNFTLSFSVLPPDGATKDFVRLSVLRPLQAVLKSIAPRAALTSVSVNTQESNSKILRQTVKVSISVNPPVEFVMNENVEEVPEVNLDVPEKDIASTVVSTLQNQIAKSAAAGPTEAKTLSIPFVISPPAGTTKQDILETYVIPISQVLARLDPTGKILKIGEKTLPNGDIVLIIYMNIPEKTNTNETQPESSTVNTISSTTVPPASQQPVSINNRNSFPEGEEDEVPPEVPPEVPSSSENTTPITIEVPKNAIRTPIVDLKEKTTSLEEMQKILKDALSPLTNPKDAEQPKILAIPFKMKPKEGTTIQQIEENVVGPIGKVLSNLEPTGNVITSQTKTLPDGEVESVLYFNVPSVQNSKTYKDISKDLENPITVKPINTIEAITNENTIVSSPVTEEVNQEPKVQPNTQSNNEEPNVTPATPTEKVEKNSLPNSQNPILITPIDIKNPDIEALTNQIKKSIEEANAANKQPPEEIGIPLIISKKLKSRFFEIALKNILSIVLPGEVSPNPSYKDLPNGDVEMIFNYKPTKKEPEETVTTVANIASKSASSDEVKPVEGVEPAVTEATKVSPVTENQKPPYEAIIVPPIDETQPFNFDNLRNNIIKNIDAVESTNNGQPQVIGLPFVMPKKSFLLELALKKSLALLLPGEILPETQTKNLPNGKVELTVYYKKPIGPNKNSEQAEISVTSVVPPVANENPESQEKDVSSTTAATPSSSAPVTKIAEKIVPESPTILTTEATETKPEAITETPENPVPLYDAVLTRPLNANNPNMVETIREDVQKLIEEVNEANNPHPKVVGIPFVMPHRSFFLEHSLKLVLRTLLPGELLPETQTKNLPDGKEEFIVYYKNPANPEEKPKVVTEKTAEKIIPESRTLSTTEATETKPEAVTESSENPVPLYDAVLTRPLNVDNPSMVETIREDVQKLIDEVDKTNNPHPQVVGIPFIMPHKSFFLQHSLRLILQSLLPGELLPETQTKNLPGGQEELIIYYKRPALPEEKPAAVTEKAGKKIVPESRSLLTTEPTETTPKLTTESSQNIGENVSTTKPLTLQNLDFDKIKDGVEERVKEAIKTNNGQSQTISIPFVFPYEPNYFIKLSLIKVLESILPGEVSQNPQTKVLPNGQSEVLINYKIPIVENKQAEELSEPVEAVEDINLDTAGVSIPGEVGRALTKVISTLTSNPQNMNNPVKLKFNIYAPLDNTGPQNEDLLNNVKSELTKLEPKAKIVSSKVNQNPGKTDPDGVIEISLPSVESSETAQNLKNAIKIPTIDINKIKGKLVDNIKDLLQQTSETSDQNGNQLFSLTFRLNPFDTEGSVKQISKALEAVDPTGEIVSHKIVSGPDGLDYLEVIYLIPSLKNEGKKKKPKVVYESFVNIDTRNPLNGLLEKVISEVGAAEDDAKGTKLEQLVDLPLDFKFINSKGLSDSEVSKIISKTLPVIKGYINQILPDGNILSVDTVDVPDSDDVVLKIVVKTPYEPDNTIVIEEKRPKSVTTTTHKPKPKSIFDFLGR